MSNMIMVLGNSGTGKSTSIKSLDPKETVIIQVLKKPLPFKGSKTLYNIENKNLLYAEDADTLIRYLQAIDKKLPDCKNIVIDDATYIMRNEFFKRALEKGYEKFSVLAQHFQQMMLAASLLRDDLNVFIMMHSEDCLDGAEVDTYKCATVGKMLDDKYDPIHCVTILLFSSVQFNQDGTAQYGFYTNRTIERKRVIPAKSPCGMFDDLFIPNDLQYVVNKINEYNI